MLQANRSTESRRPRPLVCGAGVPCIVMRAKTPVAPRGRGRRAEGGVGPTLTTDAGERANATGAPAFPIAFHFPRGDPHHRGFTVLVLGHPSRPQPLLDDAQLGSGSTDMNFVSP